MVQKRKKLANVVFHRIDLLTELVKLIFYHSSEEKWRQHIVQSHNSDHSISCRKYEQMVQLFLNSGMMNQCLLEDVIRESEFSFEIAVEVLKVFHIICGPVNKTSYIVPYFSQKVITVTETGSYVPLKVEMAFN